MERLSLERKGTFLRASVCDVCNFSCEYCATDLGMENHTPKCLNAPLLSAEAYVENLKLLAGHGFEIISFTGGEPLLAKDIDQLLEAGRKIFKKVEITTNGSKVLEHLDLIKKNVDILKISIDAVDRDLRVNIAHNPDAADTLRVIEECCKAGMESVGLNFVYMKQNREELPALVEYVKGLNEKYQTDIYISVLDLYYSRGNQGFWEEQFVNLKELRADIRKKGIQINRRLRVGCDSYNCRWKGVLVNMKDSISCTHRSALCDTCKEYCQEGIYSLKHSASGWISVCPTNNPKLGSLLAGDEKSGIADRYINQLNAITRVDHTGQEFFLKNGLKER